MRHLLWTTMALVALAAYAAPGASLREPGGSARAPEFTHVAPAEWLNSAPLTLSALAGQVVLVEFWTFDCYNCYRTVPWLRQLHARLEGRGARIVSVHTPEFARERDVANVRRKLDEFGIRYPVMLDNDYSYWKAFANQFWPAFYLLDRQGRIRASYAGETHPGDRQARRIEADIETLLAEGQPPPA